MSDVEKNQTKELEMLRQIMRGPQEKSQQEKDDEFDRQLVKMDIELDRRFDPLLEGSIHRVKTLAPSDPVNHPDHYTTGGIETIDYMEAKLSSEEFRGYCRGSILKYVSRAGLKDDTLSDLRKAEWYIRRLIATYNKER